MKSCFSARHRAWERSLNMFLLGLALPLLIFSGGARAAETIISGTVTAAEGGSINGLVLIEEGRLYGKNFRYGGLVQDGRFSVRVEGGGSYGLHLYATGYVYFPLGIQVDEGKDNRGQYRVPPNPASAMGPAIGEVSFKKENNRTRITLGVSDPNGDLSHQVLAVNALTGEGFRMDPPGFVLPFTRNYPQGIYTLFYSGREEADPGNWYFVAADNKCYNSPVLGRPFSEDGIVRAKRARDAEVKRSATTGGAVVSGSATTSGSEVFATNCSMCHLTDSGEVKVGPGLKGLYSLDRTPALGNPVTDPTIRRQILEGGKDMPPYSHLTEEEAEAVMEYLKGL